METTKTELEDDLSRPPMTVMNWRRILFHILLQINSLTVQLVHILLLDWRKLFCNINIDIQQE